MAELNTLSKKTSKKYSHKLARVDLTPMVDLGFLLITFFILTTSMQQLEVMRLILPKDTGPQTFLAASTTLTFILEGHDSLGYYDGLSKKTKYAGFGAMRSIIQQKQISLTNNHINKNNLTLVIRPTAMCSYKNFIDALDEITINNCSHYFIADLDKDEIL